MAHSRHEKLIHELFEQQVLRTPDASAAVYADQSLTYAQLNAKANQVAWHLRDVGVLLGDLVGICAERSLEFVVGILGVLKAGAAYLPLDPGYPTERLKYTLRDAALKIVLTQKVLEERFSQESTQMIVLDSDESEIWQRDIRNLDAVTSERHCRQLAYVIYTSGST